MNQSAATKISAAGIGLRKDHFSDLFSQKPGLGFLEVHPENYFSYGPHIEKLDYFAEFYPLSFHGVGLSLGSFENVSKKHLHKLKILIDKYNPILVSDHASWSMSGNAHTNDLLPLPYNEESLNKLCDNINATQDYLGRQILIENPSTYLEFKNSMSEYEFMATASEKTKCKILLDLNNIFVNFKNHQNCPYTFIDNIPNDSIGEIHLAGHSVKEIDGAEIRIDTHSTPVCNEVWSLYDHLIDTKEIYPTLIEWDLDIPNLNVLLSEANKANLIMNKKVKNDAA